MNAMARSIHRAACFAAAALLLSGCETTTTISRTPGGAPAADPRGAAPASGEADNVRRARVRMELANAYFSRGQMEVALEEVKRAIEADPTQSAPYSLRGLIYSSLGDERLAEEAFRRALQLDGRDAGAMHNFGWFLCQRKRYDESFAMFDQALAVPLYRDAARTLLAKGVCLALDKQYAEAERTLDRSLRFEPNNPSTLVNLAEVQHRLGQNERARLTLRRLAPLPQGETAQTLWLSVRVERALGNQIAVAEYGNRLRSKYPTAPETEAFVQGRFGD